MCLKPTMTVEAIIESRARGSKSSKPGAELYIRPMYWAEHNSPDVLGLARRGFRPASVCAFTKRLCLS